MMTVTETQFIYVWETMKQQLLSVKIGRLKTVTWPLSDMVWWPSDCVMDFGFLVPLPGEQ